MYSRHLIRNYGITFEQFSALLVMQAGCCAICETPMMNNREPHVDHCHRTGAVRGLLCFACNLMIANAKESRERLLKGIEYLRIYNSDRR
jgi:hypothetical protein